MPSVDDFNATPAIFVSFPVFGYQGSEEEEALAPLTDAKSLYIQSVRNSKSKIRTKSLSEHPCREGRAGRGNLAGEGVVYP